MRRAAEMWPDDLRRSCPKLLIKRIKSVIKSTVSTIKKVATKKKKLECVVDNQKVNCETFKDTNWVGYPAPESIPYDPWFGSAPKSQKAIQY